jgi:hypothetical protein
MIEVRLLYSFRLRKEFVVLAPINNSHPLSTSGSTPPPQEPRHLQEHRGESLKGFGGWLILLLLILLIVYPLQTIVGIAVTASSLSWPNPLSSGELSKSVIYWTLISMIFGVSLMSCGIYAGMKLIKIKPGAVRTTKIFLVGVFVYNLAMFVLTLLAEHRGNMRLDDAVTAELRNVVFSLFWYVYLEMSKRVAATYSDTQA